MIEVVVSLLVVLFKAIFTFMAILIGYYLIELALAKHHALVSLVAALLHESSSVLFIYTSLDRLLIVIFRFVIRRLIHVHLGLSVFVRHIFIHRFLLFSVKFVFSLFTVNCVWGLF